MSRIPRGLLRLAVAVAVAGCSRSPWATAEYPDPHQYRFAGYTRTCGGIPGYLPAEQYGAVPAYEEGICTWYLWTGGDPLATEGPPQNARGNPRFWRMAEKHTATIARDVGLPINFVMMKVLDSRQRAERFTRYGFVNDPGCRPASGRDVFGLWLDDCQDPYSAGVMGLRLFPNPQFKAAKWDPQKFLNEDPSIEPPYLVGLTCGLCHITFNPLTPPADPAEPRWENLVPALANQYFKEGEVFKGGLTEDHFLYWVYQTQEAGTSDTSRISNDFINNPSAVNAIFSIVSGRPTHPEVMPDGKTEAVPRILKDGADSIGAGPASMRVFVNIGSCPDYRMSVEDTFAGLARRQEPFDPGRAFAECRDLQLTGARMPALGAFLDSIRPYYLKDAPGGQGYLAGEPWKLGLGKRVFAENCARCHSSKVPERLAREGIDKHAPEAKPAWVELVMRDDFLEGNFLSDDERYPVVSKDWRFGIGTNLARAVATNAIEGHVWQNFSSRTYKNLPSPGHVRLFNPVDPANPIDYEIPAGGRGYYRTPSLVNIWATAPFLHNNALGLYNHDPSVEGRMDAFMDAVTRLLWPDKRLGPRSIKVTGRDTNLRVRVGLKSLDVRVPAGTPVNLLANVDLQRVMDRSEQFELFTNLLKDPAKLVGLVRVLKNEGQYDAELRLFVPALLRYNLAPDFIEDRGHDFGARLSDEEKWALIEFLKTF